MHKNKIYLLGGLLSAFALGGPLGCGDDGGGGGAATPVGVPESDEQTSANTSFNAELREVNGNIGRTSNPAGIASFSTADSNFSASVAARGLASNVRQMQHIHVGARCPTEADDSNRDGIIDAVEEAAASGQILIPLDNDLARQASPASDNPSDDRDCESGDESENCTGDDRNDGNGHDNSGRGIASLEPYATPSLSPSPSPTPSMSGYPVTDSRGTYTYSQSVNIEEMLTDLRGTDPNPSDSVTKLGSGAQLGLENRVVMIHGVPSTTILPATVRSIDGLPAHMTLPVACGEINPGAAAQPSPTPGASPSPTASPSPSATPTLN